jgi:hypothetical protein
MKPLNRLIYFQRFLGGLRNFPCIDDCHLQSGLFFVNGILKEMMKSHGYEVQLEVLPLSI